MVKNEASGQGVVATPWCKTGAGGLCPRRLYAGLREVMEDHIYTVPEGVEILNFAFDVTPARLISAIITEKGVLRAPFDKAVPELLA